MLVVKLVVKKSSSFKIKEGCGMFKAPWLSHTSTFVSGTVGVISSPHCLYWQTHPLITDDKPPHFYIYSSMCLPNLTSPCFPRVHGLIKALPCVFSFSGSLVATVREAVSYFIFFHKGMHTHPRQVASP